MQFSWKNPLKALPVLLLLTAYAGAAFGAAGNVQFVIGDVKLITKSGQTRALQKGAEINEGDRIVTGAGASAQIKMADGGFIAVRPDTNMGFDTYHYSGKEDGTENAAISLLQGGFRTITGIIGRTNKQNYQIKTETATIGIRGTDHEPMVILAPAPGRVAVAAPGTYDKVNVGVAFIRTDAGSVDIQRNQVGFAPVSKAAPMILPRIPPFYKPTPAPGPQKAKEEAKEEGKKDSPQSAAATGDRSGEGKSGEAKKEAASTTTTETTATTAAAAAPAEKAADAPAPIRSTAVVDPTSTISTAPAVAPSAPPVATAPAAIAPVVSVKMTDASGTTVNATNQTLTSATGTPVPITEGVFASQAQAAADAAAASASALNTLLTAAGSSALSTAASAMSAAQSALSSASTAGTGIAALTIIDSGLAASNATAAAALAATAASQVSAATAKFNTNGSFADPTIAVPAFAALNAANAALQTASGSAQTAAGTLTAQSSTLASIQTAASAALSAANQALSAGNSALAALTAAAVPSSSTASNLLSSAQAAASAAQAAATQAKTLQGTGDLSGAQAQLAIAQQQALTAANALASAGQILTAVSSASAAQAAAASLTAASTGSLSAATSAQAAGASAVSTIAAQLAAAQAQVSSVQQNSVLAQYSNPAVASSNFISSFSGLKSVTGGVERVMDGPWTLNPNTNYVLDGNKSLVEIRSVGYDRSGLNYSAAVINNADIVFSGGTAKDQANDPNGTYYLGRWSGGQIGVKDLASTNPVAPFADLLGASSAHWIIGLFPGNSVANPSINNVQQVVGTASYSLAAATHPTDAAGNVGTLNNATLSANFSAQTVNASLGLSFSSTDPANVSTRNLSLSADAKSVPIQHDGFEAKSGSPYAPVVKCSGADCAASGYAGGIGGTFLAAASGGATSGAVGTGAAIVYGFAPVVATPPANQAYTDSIQGVAALSTGAAPTAGTAAVPISGGTGGYRLQVIAPQTVGTSTYNAFYNVASGVATNAANYLFDPSGNLVRIQSTDYRLSDRGITKPPSYSNGAVPYTGMPGDLPSSPLTGVSVAFSGGTAPDGNYNDAVNGIRLGRYTGGTVTTTDFSTAYPLIYYADLGSNSLHWAVREIPGSVPLTGSFDYTPAFATKPTDSLGNVGTLNYASLSANFTTQTVSPAVGVTVNNQTLSAAATDVPIDTQFGFNVSSNSQQNPSGGTLRVSCSGSNCAPAPVGINVATPAYLSYIYTGYGGRIQGGLGGASAAGGAFFRYAFNTYYNPLATAGSAGGIPSTETRPVNDYVDGLVAFTKGNEVAVPGSAIARQLFRTAYLSLDAGGFNQGRAVGYRVSPTDFTSPFGSGSPNTIGNPSGSGAWETLTGGTVAQAETNANSFAATGISFGRYDGGTLTGADGQGTAFTRTVANTYAWIKGPDAPGMIAAMTGSARYKFDGGTMNGATSVPFTGKVNSAVLAVNFNTAAVGVDLSVTGNGGSPWTATTSGSGVLTGNPAATLRLGNTGSFSGASWNAGNPELHASLFVTKNSSAVNAAGISGQINGNLMGSSLSGAGLSYSFNDTSTAPGGGPQGAVAFALDSYTSTPTPNNASGSATLVPTTVTGTSAIDLASVPYQVRLTASGLIANPTATPANAPASVDSSLLTQVRRALENTGRLPLGSDGLPTAWDGVINITTTPTCTPTPCTAFVTQVPARGSIDPSSFVATGATPATNAAGQALQVALPANKTPATVLEAGFDPATGMRWGRYGGGVIALFDRIGGGFAPTTYDATNQNWHTILGPTQTGPVTLPITGTFTYTNVGGTHPTDNLGSAAGTLNAATLVADFGLQTVSTGVNLTVNGTTWAAGATAVPIQSGAQFSASRDPTTGGNLNICSGTSCGTTTLPTASTANTSGRIMGSFNGASGKGAGVAYSLNSGGLTGTTVSGVAVFKR